MFIVIFALLVGDSTEARTVSFFYSISEFIKSCIVAILPFIIFSFISYALSSLQGGGLKLVFIIFVGVFISNFITMLVAYFASHLIISFGSTMQISDNTSVIENIFAIGIPRIVSNDIGLILGLIFGLFISYTYNSKGFLGIESHKLAEFTKKISGISLIFLKKCFVPIIPIFIFGYVMKLVHDKSIITIIQGNVSVVLYMCLVMVLYIGSLLFYAAGFKLNKVKEYCINILPPAITGFTTLSSAAALPLSIKATYSNTHDEIAADVFIPATVNIHMLADNLCLPIIILVLMSSFGYPPVAFTDYVLFLFWGTLGRFAVSGVPAGSTIVMAPIMEQYLGADGQVTAMMVAFYILFETVATSFNVTGNNIVAIIFSNKVSKKLKA